MEEPLAAEVEEEVVAEGVSVPLPVLELPEPQLGEEGVAPLLAWVVLRPHPVVAWPTAG